MNITIQLISMDHTIIHKAIIGIIGAEITMIIMQNKHSMEIISITLQIISLVTEVTRTITQVIKTIIETAQIIITDQMRITEEWNLNNVPTVTPMTIITTAAGIIPITSTTGDPGVIQIEMTIDVM